MDTVKNATPTTAPFVLKSANICDTNGPCDFLQADISFTIGGVRHGEWNFSQLPLRNRTSESFGWRRFISQTSIILPKSGNHYVFNVGMVIVCE
ncbi:MAG: hypothetical protein IPN26_03610 [Bacteroidetes bacterium]|nr:hypothetical protein [Bacteroidota bacterium]